MRAKTRQFLLFCCLILTHQLQPAFSNTCSQQQCDTNGFIDDFETLSILDQQKQWLTILSDESITFTPFDVMRGVNTGIKGTASITRTLFSQYGTLLKEVLPKLSLDEQRQVRDVFARYHSMLMTSQKFITRTTMLVKQAKTQGDLLRAIDAKILEHLIDEAEILLTQFREVHDLFHGKVKDERVNKMLADFTKFTLILVACAVVGTVTYGLAVGFTPVVTKAAYIAVSALIPTAGAAKIADTADKSKIFGQLIENLKEIKSQLSKLSQDYARIDGMQDVLTMDDKEDFLNVLTDAQKEVNQGFEILSRF